MLVHLSPQIYACPTNEVCELIDLTCAELGLSLKADQELTARRPYPNKNYLVACRKVGQKAMNGILIDTQAHVSEFTVVTRWAVAARQVATHRVRYIVLDNEYDTVTDNMVLWYGTSETSGGFKSRWPNNVNYDTPARTQPRMEIFSKLDRCGDFKDLRTPLGALYERSEVFQLHTVPRERVLNVRFSADDRIPGIEHAFRADEESPRQAG